jgi:acyl carrier protein
MTTEDRVRRVVADVGGLTVDMGRLGDEDDLFAAGMTSHASVNVMLELENEFEIEFPDEMLERTVFQSVGNIAAAVSELQSRAA